MENNKCTFLNIPPVLDKLHTYLSRNGKNVSL